MLDEASRCTVASKNPPEQPYVRVVEVGEYSIVMRLYLWLDSPMDLYAARWELNEAIKKRFDTEGIEIPFPYRTIVYKKDLAA